MDSEYRYFKFRAISDRFLESMSRPSWYFASPEGLNDPFDCRINLRATFKRALKAADGRQKAFLQAAIEHPDLLDDFGDVFRTLGICSFSLSPNNALMWSHYADEHRGVCVLYGFSADLINDRRNKYLGADTVKYNTLSFRKMLTTHDLSNKMSYINELLKHYLTTKSPAWRYEREVRIIRQDQGLFYLPPTSIKQICFGLQANDTDIERVMRVAEAHCEGVRFTQMRRDGREFGFRMKPL